TTARGCTNVRTLASDTGPLARSGMSLRTQRSAIEVMYIAVTRSGRSLPRAEQGQGGDVVVMDAVLEYDPNDWGRCTTSLRSATGCGSTSVRIACSTSTTIWEFDWRSGHGRCREKRLD